jgi:hypothetical protein
MPSKTINRTPNKGKENSDFTNPEDIFDDPDNLEIINEDNTFIDESEFDFQENELEVSLENNDHSIEKDPEMNQKMDDFDDLIIIEDASEITEQPSKRKDKLSFNPHDDYLIHSLPPKIEKVETSFASLEQVPNESTMDSPMAKTNEEIVGNKGGFFDDLDENDEVIALSNEELDNILEEVNEDDLIGDVNFESLPDQDEIKTENTSSEIQDEEVEAKGGFFDEQEDDDEIIALSDEELGNILEDVKEEDTIEDVSLESLPGQDEIQVHDDSPDILEEQTLGKGGFFDEQEDDDEIIALSDEELGNILDDVKEEDAIEDVSIESLPDQNEIQVQEDSPDILKEQAESKGGFFDGQEDDDEIIGLSDEELENIMGDLDESHDEDAGILKEFKPKGQKESDAILDLPIDIEDDKDATSAMEDSSEFEDETSKEEEDLTLDLDSLDIDIEDDKDATSAMEDSSEFEDETPKEEEDLTLDLDSLDIDIEDDKDATSAMEDSSEFEDETSKEEEDLTLDLDSLDIDIEDDKESAIAIEDSSMPEDDMQQKEEDFTLDLDSLDIDIEDQKDSTTSLEDISELKGLPKITEEEELSFQKEITDEIPKTDSETDEGLELKDEVVEDIIKFETLKPRSLEKESAFALLDQEDAALDKKTAAKQKIEIPESKSLDDIGLKKQQEPLEVLELEEEHAKIAEEEAIDSLREQEAIKGSPGMPTKEELKTMITYLDSLFNNLPDEAIKKFANSEYFDLYISILGKLGIN